MKPKPRTLTQIKNDIKKGEEGKEEVEKTYEEIAEKKKSIINKVDFILLLVTLVLFAFAILERSRVMALVSGVALILVVMKMAYGQWAK